MTFPHIDMEYLKSWKGRQEMRYDVVGVTPVTALAKTLDCEGVELRRGDALPLLWHWLFFLPLHYGFELGNDGHPAKGRFFPPVPFPRRMWAGGRLSQYRSPRIGEEIKRVSTIKDVVQKTGTTGELIFVTVCQEIFAGDEILIEDQQDIVYRDKIDTSMVSTATHKPVLSPDWSHEITPDPVLLFRYSALTFNSHRIHYDREYAQEVEGYTDLIVQAPLMLTIMLQLCHYQYPQATVRRITYRSLKPAYVSVKYYVQGSHEGNEIELWICDEAGVVTLSAQVQLVSGEVGSGNRIET